MLRVSKGYMEIEAIVIVLKAIYYILYLADIVYKRVPLIFGTNSLIKFVLLFFSIAFDLPTTIVPGDIFP